MSRKVIPPYIRNLEPSKFKTGWFDISWDGIIYTLSKEKANDLADYFKLQHRNNPSVREWYERLSNEEQQEVMMQSTGK